MNERPQSHSTLSMPMTARDHRPLNCSPNNSGKLIEGLSVLSNVTNDESWQTL